MSETKEKKFPGENTMVDLFEKAHRRTRRQDIEFYGLLVGLLVTIGGGIWYASTLTTQKQVQTSMERYAPSRIEFARIESRIEAWKERNRRTEQSIEKQLEQLRSDFKARWDRFESKIEDFSTTSQILKRRRKNE